VARPRHPKGTKKTVFPGGLNVGAQARHPDGTPRLFWGKLRTPTDHELPRGFPGGGFAMSALGIKERQDGRQPDLTTPRGRNTTAALVTRASGDVACAAWAKVGMGTNPTAVMLVDLRRGGNKHRHENGGDSTGRDGVSKPHRSVGGHNFSTKPTERIRSASSAPPCPASRRSDPGHRPPKSLDSPASTPTIRWWVVFHVMGGRRP
jgi:hypothetical protein